MKFSQFQAVHDVTAALITAPKGLTEDTLYREWDGAISKQQYHEFLNSGIDDGALVRQPDGKVNFTPTARAHAKDTLANMEVLQSLGIVPTDPATVGRSANQTKNRQDRREQNEQQSRR